MKDIQQLFAEAAKLKNKRDELVKNIRDIDEQHRIAIDKLDTVHAFKIKDYESERDTFLFSEKDRAKNEIAHYVQMKNNLQLHAESIRKWCSQEQIIHYQPNPNNVSEMEISHLVQMIQEQGMWTQLKRTLKIGGYASKGEMALETNKKIEDACAFCNQKIEEIEDDFNKNEVYKITAVRRKITAEKEQLEIKKQEMETQMKVEKERVMKMLDDFDSSLKSESIYDEILQLRLEEELTYGKWGEYQAPTQGGKRVVLGHTQMPLLNQKGIEEKMQVPIWLNLLESNIIVVTHSYDNLTSMDCKGIQFVRKLLMRMLKTIPTENCNYWLINSSQQSTELEELADVPNVKFQFFSSEAKDVLLNCYIDFRFPDNPDEKLLEDIKELFKNLSTLKFTLVFVTTSEGLELIKKMATVNAKTSIVHVDCDSMVYKKGDFQAPLMEKDSPQSDQISNFISILRKSYHDVEPKDINQMGEVDDENCEFRMAADFASGASGNSGGIVCASQGNKGQTQYSKLIHVAIGGRLFEFPNTKTGMAKAYRMATQSGDTEMAARMSKSFKNGVYEE